MNTLSALFLRKVRGVRVVNIAGAGCLALMVLTVYWSKAAAGSESARIADTTRQIAAEAQRVRLLQAQRAYLAQPERLRRLSEQYLGMAPVKPAHEAAADALIQLTTAPAHPATPAPTGQVQ